MTLMHIENIHKVYKTEDIEVKALQDVSLKINAGDFVSVMGPSGSGKSTFMNIIGCLDKSTSGKYFLDGVDVSFLERDELADIRNHKIGFIFQGFNLVPRTSAIENVELPMIYKGVPSDIRKQKAIEALEMVGLEDRIHHTPNQLSGGQQQRVAIARALVNDAPLILADEPTGNLDTQTSQEIMELFVRLNQKSIKTIILVTHESDIAEYSSRIIRFKDGKIISDKVKAQND